jgi:hypothetical protein
MQGNFTNFSYPFSGFLKNLTERNVLTCGCFCFPPEATVGFFMVVFYLRVLVEEGEIGVLLM